jgi:hypothetical protein
METFDQDIWIYQDSSECYIVYIETRISCGLYRFHSLFASDIMKWFRVGPHCCMKWLYCYSTVHLKLLMLGPVLSSRLMQLSGSI